LGIGKSHKVPPQSLAGRHKVTKSQDKESIMVHKKINRKDFLMYALGLVAAGVIGRREKISRFFEKKPQRHWKEAKFYKRADHLAG